MDGNKMDKKSERGPSLRNLHRKKVDAEAELHCAEGGEGFRQKEENLFVFDYTTESANSRESTRVYQERKSIIQN